MRVSLYTRFVDLQDGSTLVLNLPRRTADIVPNSAVDRLRAADASDEPDELLRYALRAGYLTEAEERDEIEWFAELVRTEAGGTQAANVSVVTANSCNLACSYCFQADTGMRDVPQRYLSMPEARRAMAGIAELSAGRGVDHLELFGGEPLLPRTREVVHFLVSEAAALGLTTRATTNGVHLDQFADLIGPDMVNDLQISVDGSREDHDARRIPRSGTPTFDRILSNIEMAVAAGAHVLIRPNIDRRNIAGLPELLRELRRRGLAGNPSVTVRYVNVHRDPMSAERGVGDHYMSLAEVEATVAAEFPEVAELWDPRATPTPLGEYLRELMASPTFDACGAPTRNVYFSPEGRIYNCHELVGRPERAVGRFESGRIVELPLWDKWRSRRVDQLENCRRCNVALAHGGGCGARLDPDRLGTHGVCGDFPREFDARLVALARQANAGGGIDD